ncbi:MAG: hypothetical protein AVDCRST_MAG77-2879 [uncultured Chloroflexi bacterium]|uniref:Uncharacterized protein n=1 Tax=uncultured Chloroflexota bacterium TaxID=166587 RepID=A0A6J4J1M2_9CHLR|nr:MAG: hypothetical protein AVDCRST_MAG77-2879 [uncultured Chloroflexota bacterium]
MTSTPVSLPAFRPAVRPIGTAGPLALSPALRRRANASRARGWGVTELGLPAGLLAGALLAAHVALAALDADMMDFDSAVDYLREWVYLGGILAWTALLVALRAVHRAVHRSGRIGAQTGLGTPGGAGWWLAVLGHGAILLKEAVVLAVGIALGTPALLRLQAAIGPLYVASVLASLVGCALLGAGVLRAGVLPRWAGVALLLSYLVVFPLGEYAPVAQAVLVVAIALALHTAVRAGSRRPVRA